MVAFAATRCDWALQVLILLAVTVVGPVRALDEGASCLNPAGLPGKCILFRACEPLVAIFTKSVTTPEEELFLQESRCGELGRKVLVCCVAHTAEVPKLPSSPECGLQLSDRIVGGEETDRQEFPWTALIEYKKYDNTFGYHCGGSIINQRYIVTAAHCIVGLPRAWQVHRVRLGEWDLSTEPDCDDVNDDECNATPVDVDIEELIPHPRYDLRDDSKANDIALIRFTRDVPYSKTIRPICLPLSEAIRSRNHEGLPAFSAGWGKTETGSKSVRKLKVDVKIKSLQECAPVFRRNGIILKSVHTCAGGERGKDTCTGDSGGPLMRQFAGAWYLLGVVSFGSQKCGSYGVPGIYVNVTEYTDWIQENVK